MADALARIAARPELNAVITVCEEQALARARAGVSGALAGVPVLIKDLIDTAGVRTTYASSIYADHVPQRQRAVGDSRSRPRARSSWARRTPTSSRGACAARTRSTATPSTRPRPTAWPAGRAAATRRRWRPGMVPLGLGTDTGGSVRLPAACCGVVGLKTGRGAVSTQGVYPLAASFDTVGPLATHGGRLRAGVCRAHRHRGAGARAGRPARRGADRLSRRSGPPTPRRRAAARRARAGPRRSAARARARDVRELALPVPEGDTWAVFYAETAAAHAATFPSRRDEYGPLIRAKLDHAITVTAEQEREGRRALRRVARRRGAASPTSTSCSRRRWATTSCRRPASTSSACGCPSRPTRAPSATWAGPRSRSGPLQLAGRDAGGRHRRGTGPGARRRGALASAHARDQLHPRQHPRL